MINFGWPVAQIGIQTFKMLQAAILTQFNFIKDREGILSFQIFTLLKSQSWGLRGDRMGGRLLVINARPRPF